MASRDGITHAREDELFHLTIGSGVPLLALHGGPGWDHSYLRSALDPLGDVAAITYTDLPGNGRSPGPTTEREWKSLRVSDVADQIDQLRERLGITRMILFGHSFGGAVAQEYALRHPDRLYGLILVASYPAFDYAPVVLDGMLRVATEAQRAALLEAFSAPLRDDSHFRDVWQTVLRLYFSEGAARAGDDAFANSIPRAAAYNWGVQVALRDFSTLERLRELELPVLIVSGDQDRMAPLEHAALRLVRGIGGAELEVFEGAGHFPFVEQPSRWETAVRRWLSRMIGDDRGGARQDEERAG